MTPAGGTPTAAAGVAYCRAMNPVVRLRWGAAGIVASALLACTPAEAAEAPVGSSSRVTFSQFDDVPGLLVGTTARRSGVEDSGLFVQIPRRRCQSIATVWVTLVGDGPDGNGARLRARRLRLRGSRRPSMAVRARQADFGGVDPTSVVTLRGRVPADLAPGEPRRTVVLTIVVTSEEEGCLRTVRRLARRVAPAFYLRQARSGRSRVAPLHSPTRRIDGGAPVRLGGPGPGTGLGAELEDAGDVDGDHRADILLQEGNALGDLGVRRRGVVRFGGPLGLADVAGLGAGGFSVAGGPESATYGSTFAGAGTFLGGPTAALAAAVEGRRAPGSVAPPGTELIAAVIPGRRYRGYLGPRRPPPGALRIVGRRGCGSIQPRVERVGDVNGDGRDDLFLARVDGCAKGHAAIVFGRGPGTVSLDALGGAGIALDPEQVDDEALVEAGDVNGDGLDDMALVGGDLYEQGRDEITIVLGRRGTHPLSLESGPGLVRLRRRGCQDLGDVAPAGDLDGDGDGELVVAIGECADRPFGPDVAHVLRGTPAAPGRLRLGPATGTTIRSRFGPLPAPQVAAGRDVAGGPGADIALGFDEGGPSREGEAWLVHDVGAAERLTLGALGPRGARLLGGVDGLSLGTDVAFAGDQTGDARADLLVGAPEEDFAGRPGAGSVYIYSAGAAPGLACRVVRTGTGRVRGTDLGDVLTGSPGPDRVVGFEGGDCLRGLGGADRLVGDPGADRLDGGPGPDRLSGGPGRDVLSGGPGDDYLIGGSRGDRMAGGAGGDRIDASGAGGDRVRSGPGNDRIQASDRGRDHIDCGPGRDTVVADPGDTLRGCERVRRRSPPVYDD